MSLQELKDCRLFQSPEIEFEAAVATYCPVIVIPYIAKVFSVFIISSFLIYSTSAVDLEDVTTRVQGS